MMKDFKLYKGLSVLACCLLLGISTIPAMAQSSESSENPGYQFWYATFDARSMSMANATSADPLNPNKLYSNPGLLPFNPQKTALGFHSSYNSTYNVLVENITSTAFSGKDKKMVIGATMLTNSNKTIPSQPATQLSFTQFNLDVAYGQMLTSSLSMGVKVNVDYGKTEAGSAYTTNASVGAIYAPSTIVSYGLVYRGTGYRTEWLGSGLSYIGSAQGPTQISATKLPHRLEIGTTLRLPSMAEYPDFAISLSNEKLFGEPGLVYRGGLEIYFWDKFVMRGGYFYSSFVQGGRVGAGFVLEPLKINYAFANNTLDQNGRNHLLSITLDF